MFNFFSLTLLLLNLLHVSSAASFLMNSSSQCLALSGVRNLFSLLDKDMHLEEDEQLARALQVSLNVPSHRNGSVNGGNALSATSRKWLCGWWKCNYASHPIILCALIWIQVRFSLVTLLFWPFVPFELMVMK